MATLFVLCNKIMKGGTFLLSVSSSPLHFLNAVSHTPLRKSFRNKHSVYVDFLTRFWDHSHTFSQYILQELNWLLSKQKSSPSMQFEMQDVEIHVLQPLLLVY